MNIYYILIAIVVIVLIGVGYFLLTEDPLEIEPDNDLEEMDLRTEFVPEEGIESQEIRVLNEDDEIIFQLTINELNQWTEENWHIFDEEPEVGGRPVEPDGFAYFDIPASISPDNSKLVFSVSDYAALTTTSFIMVADLRTSEINMISEPTMGGVENYYWSEDSERFAYSVGTARATGDFLVVDDAGRHQRVFILGEEELLNIIDPDEEIVEVGQFMPAFQELEWSEERIYFVTEHPDNGFVRWSINGDGNDLRREDLGTYKSSLLDVSLEYPSLATVNYEDERLKITYVGPDSAMAEITDGFTLFVDVIDPDDREMENIADQEFEERSQVTEPIEPPYSTEINGKDAISFEIEGGLGGEHVFFVFEEDDKIIITSQFIADPHERDYEVMVRDIILSIDTA